MGDGWHNYHHCFPWDYRSSEFGNQGGLATNVIDFFAWLGMAYDLRTAPAEIIHGHARRHGDGTHFKVAGEPKDVSGIKKIWMSGLGIVDQPQEQPTTKISGLDKLLSDGMRIIDSINEDN